MDTLLSRSKCAQIPVPSISQIWPFLPSSINSTKCFISKLNLKKKIMLLLLRVSALVEIRLSSVSQILILVIVTIILWDKLGAFRHCSADFCYSRSQAASFSAKSCSEGWQVSWSFRSGNMSSLLWDRHEPLCTYQRLSSIPTTMWMEPSEVSPHRMCSVLPPQHPGPVPAVSAPPWYLLHMFCKQKRIGKRDGNMRMNRESVK